MKKGIAPSLMETGSKFASVKREEWREPNNGALEESGEFSSNSYTENIANIEHFRSVLHELRKPLPDMVKQRVGWTDRYGREHKVDYIEWHSVADLLDEAAPNWSYTIRNLQMIGDLIAVTAAITINGITREGVGTGPAGNETGIKKAESDALKRAARMFGVGRDLYKDSDEDEHTHNSNNSSLRLANNGNNYNGANNREKSEQNNNRAPQPFPTDALAHSTEDLVTPRQLVALRAIANSAGIELEAECQKLLKCDVKEISRRAASALIDHLKNHSTKKQ